MFLSETLTDEARLEIVQRNINFKHWWVVPREGRGGGLVLYWKSLINLTVEASGKYYIDAIIDKNTKNAWQLIGFYGEPETARRIEAWNKLRSLNSQPDISWLCVGNFNEITSQDEKVGGAIRLTTKCSYSEMKSMNADLSIWAMWARNLHGVGTLKMANQLGKDWIEVWR